MPSARAALEKLKWLCDHGRENETVHLVMVEEEQKQRIINKKRKMKFVLNTDDADLCGEFEQEKDRIFRRVRNKSIMLSLMVRAWRDALSDPELDKIMAVMEMQDEQTHSAT